MKKGILFFITLFSSQVHSFDLMNGDYFSFAELLVWKLREGSAENWAQTISPAGSIQSIKIYDAPFGWDPGLRVGIGKTSSDQKWDYTIIYTNFQTTGQRVVNAVSGGVYSAYIGNFFANNPTGTGFGPNYENAGMNWKFAYNTLDLHFGHPIEIDSLLSLHPTIGLKAAIINQTLTSNWETPTTPTTFTVATETLKQNFWGIGPTIGLDTTWSITQKRNTSINLFGNFLGAIIAGNWKFSENYLNNTPNSVTVNLDNLVSASTVASGIVGVEWTGCFSQHDFVIQLGYEAQVWFNHVQYYNYNMGRLNNLMSLQGGVLEFYVAL